MSHSRTSRPIAKMTTGELEAMVAEFDREFVADTFGPMDAEARARHHRMKRKRGRPRVGAGSQAISVTIEKSLLQRADRLAKRLGVSRAKLIAVGLLKIVKAAEAQRPRKA
ncbi:MAG: hypothetical protein ACYS0D_02575 [Planctomycetota bacterium]|jgi:hypothetical protein